MRVAIHQPNFCPWFPFFYKMAMADVFVLLESVQFEKNGFQNRFKYKDKWITKPVHNGMEQIKDKNYVDLNGREILGHSHAAGSVSELNKLWINTIKYTLNIHTELTSDYMQNKDFKTPTHRLIAIIKDHGGNIYITNPEAKDKYLDESLMLDAGIDIEYCKVPKNLQKHTFEIFEEYGIDGAIKQLPKRKILENSSSR